MNTEKCKTFRVHHQAWEEDFDEWKSDDEYNYSWGIGPAGDLMLFRTKYQKTFSVELEKDVRWYAYAPGTWSHVEVLDT